MCNLQIDFRDTNTFLKPWYSQGTKILCPVITSQYLPLLPLLPAVLPLAQ